MKHKFYFVFLALMVSVQGFAGEREGGGGNIYVRRFVQVAKETIEELKTRPDDKYSVMLQAALESITDSDAIEMVGELEDKRGNKISEQNLYAYSWPGKIQLLDIVWLDWLVDMNTARKHKADVIHELFRTIKPNMDDDYRISLVELGLGILPSVSNEAGVNDITELLLSGAQSITGEADGSEGELWWMNNSDNVEVRRGNNISSAIQAGINASKNLKFMRFMQTCKSVSGRVNRGDCLLKGLEHMKLKVFVSSTMAKFIVKKMCGNALMAADGGRCFKATVPLIQDPLLQEMTAGCSFLNGGRSISKCFSRGLL